MTANLFHLGRPAVSKQAGVSLVIVLIFLVILSGLAITAMQGTTFAARIAGNEADRTLAFQAAEAALRDGERDIKNIAWNTAGNTFTLCVRAAGPTATPTCRAGDGIRGAQNFDTACPDGLCAVDRLALSGTTTPVWEVASNWTGTASVVYGNFTGATLLPVVSSQPRYMIEAFPSSDETIYRITALGFGANGSTQVILQAAYKLSL